MKRFSEQQIIHTLLGLLMLATTALHLWRLPEIPPGFWYDEAFNAMDAAWMAESGSPQVFLPGNNGREPMFHYLAGVFLRLLGNTPYVFRLTAALISLAAIPMIYRWTTTLFAGQPYRRWLGLFAALGLSFSFWYLVMSRSGYRAVLLPFFVTLTATLFWRGWQSNVKRFFILAGIALGLTQYTYLSARLFPLTFALFGGLWLIVAPKKGALPDDFATGWRGVRRLWLGLVLMALISAIVFLPLATFFWQNPQTFIARAGDVSVFTYLAENNLDFGDYLLEALSVFSGGSDSNWRHGLPAYSPFDWLTLTALWAGLFIAIFRFRQPAYLFLLVNLAVMWLPALLSTPPVHALRMAGVLPSFYVLAAVGVVAPLGWIESRLSHRLSPLWIKLAALAIFAAVSGGFLFHRYFVVWASEAMVQVYFEAEQERLVEDILAQLDERDALIPFDFYASPALRFRLSNQFDEVKTLPEEFPDRPALLAFNAEGVGDSFIWLTRAGDGRGKAYLSPPIYQSALRTLAQDYPAETYFDYISGDPWMKLVSLPDTRALAASFAEPTPGYGVNYVWPDQLRLVGYAVTITEATKAVTLHLYWQPQTDQPFSRVIFAQMLNARGEAVTQQDVLMASPFYWRKGRLVPQQYTMWLGPQAEPGAYLFRVGLFDLSSGERLPIFNANGEAMGEQAMLGLFYVSDAKNDFTAPDTALSVNLGDSLSLLGYSLADEDGVVLPVRLYWRASAPLDTDYTVFLQLLNEQNQAVAGWDAQPLGGLYPTSNWKAGEVVADTFAIPLPPDLPPGEYRLVTGMYNLANGERLLVTDADGAPLPDNMVTLRKLELP